MGHAELVSASNHHQHFVEQMLKQVQHDFYKKIPPAFWQMGSSNHCSMLVIVQIHRN